MGRATTRGLGVLLCTLIAAALLDAMHVTALPFLLLSWAAVGAAAFAASPTRLVFGERSPAYDAAIVLSYLLMGVAELSKSLLLSALLLAAGIVLLAVVAPLMVRAVPVARQSMLASIPSQRALAAFLLLLGIFIAIFTLLIDWAALILLASLLALAVLLWRRKRDRGYERMLRLLQSEHTVLLGISGLLLLHFLTDLAAAAWRAGLVIRGGVMWWLSVVGFLLLALLPLYIWHKTSRIRTTRSHEHLPDWRGWQAGLALSCIMIYLLAPALSIGADEHRIGVTLSSVPVQWNAPLLAGAAAILLLCAIIGALSDYGRRILMLGPVLAALYFVGLYAYQYFTSLFIRYASTGVGLVGLTVWSWALLPFLLLLFCASAAFCITGYISFLYEVWRD